MTTKKDEEESEIFQKAFVLSPVEALQNGLLPVRETLAYLLETESDFQGDRDKLDEVVSIYPQGYWYVKWEGESCSHFEIPASQTNSLLNIPSAIRNLASEIKPYIIRGQETDHEDSLDSWYCVSFYDAIPLSYALFKTFQPFFSEDGSCIRLCEDLFRKIKAAAIEKSLSIPYGREILLASTFRVASSGEEQNPDLIYRFDVERQHSIIVDRKEYYRFLVERSGIDAVDLPGAVLITYEREKFDADTQTPDSKNVKVQGEEECKTSTNPTITIKELFDEFGVSESKIGDLLKSNKVPRTRKSNNPTNPYQYLRAKARDVIIEYCNQQKAR